MQRTLLGILTPSSNTVLEPVTCEILADLDDVSAHFSRFPVTEISKTAAANAQFEIDKPLSAAKLLADAEVDAIVWSGTSASWLGFEHDEALCEAIQQRTGIPAGSSVLALNDIFQRADVKKFGLVTPYVKDIQKTIIAQYARLGFECVSERHLKKSRNFDFSEVSESQIGDMIKAVAADKPDAVAIICTNLRGARIAPKYEQKLGIPILDSTSAAVWAGLKIAGRNTSELKAWGRLFEM